MEDIDTARSSSAAATEILDTLEEFGFTPDEPVIFQSRRLAAYEHAFEALQKSGKVYPCACSRKEIADSLTRQASPATALIYPGTCRAGLPAGRTPRAWRVRVETTKIDFIDRWFGPQTQDLATAVGDFILKRADGDWAYQLAVVVDDAAQGITDIVRGADLLDSTPRQIWLQRLLGHATPRYLHVPVMTNDRGEKLSKQTGARALDRAHKLDHLHAAACHLGLTGLAAGSVDQFWKQATEAWGKRWLDPQLTKVRTIPGQNQPPT